MKLLLLGISQTGKSTYGGQLAHRFESLSQTLALKERKRPAHVRALDAVMDALLAGQAAERTAKETFDRVTFHLEDQQGRAVDVVWPEFGGEAFKDRVLSARGLPPQWAEDTKTADGLLLLLRPALDAEAPGLEATSRPVQRHGGTDEDQDPTLVTLQPDARYVELLQLILYCRDYSRRQRANLPLALGLTYWDELGEQFPAPNEALNAHYPLLAAFLRGAWAQEAWQVYGISPQGQRLSKEADEAFAEQGPTAHGFVALDDGTSNPDITLPLAWLAERVHAG